MLFSHWVVSDSLQSHGLQHTRLPCPSLCPGVCSNSCPLRQWCHPTNSSSYHPILIAGLLEDSWVPWMARRSNQSILKEINPEYSLEGLMLKLQYFGRLIQSRLIRKDLKVGKIEGRKGWQRTSRLDGITDSMDKSWSKLREMQRSGKPGVLQSMGSQGWTRLTEQQCVSIPASQVHTFLCSSPSSEWFSFFLPLLRKLFPLH